jgi:hypothetical protein
MLTKQSKKSKEPVEQKQKQKQKQKKKRAKRKLLFSNLSKSGSYFRTSKRKTVLETVSSFYPSAKKTQDIGYTENQVLHCDAPFS